MSFPLLSFLVVLAALSFLMVVAYRGHSVILFAPVAALGAVLLTDPSLVAPMFTGLFMDKMVGFLKLYFPVFVLGALFGKLIELSGFSRSIVASTIRVFGAGRAMLSIVAVCALLTYGGVSLFVVVFAVYPFAAELFRQGNIPKRLIPGTIALGAFTFTMDALPGTPQIQNIIPTSFFGTDSWAAPLLGVSGSVFILVAGLSYLEWRRRVALKNGEGYGDASTLVNEPAAFAGTALANPFVAILLAGLSYLEWRRRVAARNGEGYGDATTLVNEPAAFTGERLANPIVALLPLVLVGVANKLFTAAIPHWYGTSHSFVPAVVGDPAPVVQEISKVTAIWAVEGALLVGILAVMALAWRPVVSRFAEGTKSAIVISCSRINLTRYGTSLSPPGLASTKQLPVTNEPKICQTEGSKAIGIVCRMRSVSDSEKATCRQRSVLHTPLCVIITPFGLPVEPEV